MTRKPKRGPSTLEIAAPFRVLVTSHFFEPGFRGGGPVKSVANIIDSVPASIEISMLTSDRDMGATVPYVDLAGRWVDRGCSRVLYLNHRKFRSWLRALKDLREIKFDLLYVNSLFNPFYTLIPILATKLKLVTARTIMIAPRGELCDGALALKKRKKKLYLASVRRIIGRGNNIIWHASTSQEAAQVSAVFPTARVVVVSVDPTTLPPQAIFPERTQPGPIRLIFVSRISEKKNLDLVIEALQLVVQPANFDIYGPIEDTAYWKRCTDLMDLVPSHVNVTYRGELLPDDVRSTFAEHDLFVFPTRGENFGHVIAESLSASCPVLCSAETPWSRILDNGGGAVVANPHRGTVAAAIDRYASMTPDQLLHARRRAGAEYRSWRATVDDVNVIQRALSLQDGADPARSSDV